jgi:ribosome-binding factor A
MQSVLQKNDTLFQSLVKDGGICFREIRMSPDNTKAFVLWDTYKEDTMHATAVLRQHTGTLKHLVSKALATKKAPYFEFVANFDNEIVRRREEYDKLQEKLDEIRQHE